MNFNTDPIVNCYICNKWSYRSVMLGDNDHFHHTLKNACDGNDCFPSLRVCHVDCLNYFGLKKCPDCDIDFYNKLEFFINNIDDYFIDDDDYYDEYDNYQTEPSHSDNED